MVPLRCHAAAGRVSLRLARALFSPTCAAASCDGDAGRHMRGPAGGVREASWSGRASGKGRAVSR